MIHLIGFWFIDRVMDYMDSWNLFKVMTIEFDKKKNSYIWRVFLYEGDSLSEKIFDEYKDAEVFYKSLERS